MQVQEVRKGYKAKCQKQYSHRSEGWSSLVITASEAAPLKDLQIDNFGAANRSLTDVFTDSRPARVDVNNPRSVSPPYHEFLNLCALLLSTAWGMCAMYAMMRLVGSLVWQGRVDLFGSVAAVHTHNRIVIGLE